MSASVTSCLWFLAAGLLGFGVSAFFAEYLKLSRRVFLIPYIILTSVFLVGFFSGYQTNLQGLFSTNWLWGLVAGSAVGAFLVKNVLSQPASHTPLGWKLLLDIAWVGVAYGIIDAFFLNVMPVLVVENAATALWAFTLQGKFLTGGVALIASLLITLAYHLGYSEFRNRRVLFVLMGNALITLAFLVSGNPLGALLSHTVMHVAATIRGPETTIQLPPHRGELP